MSDAPLDPGFSVFNGHVNDADTKARALMRQFWPHYLEEVESLEKAEGGIMAIFNHPPTPATLTYTAIVTAYVNDGRLDSVELEKEESKS